jgi:putative transposase
MARQPRFLLPGYPQHVIQRGNNRNVIFAEDADYVFYMGRLNEACDRFMCRIHAYVLMTNHVHLLITPETEQGIGKVMQSLGRRYVQYFNYRYQRTGTLWEGRYKASLIDTDNYLLACYRYIELNPVRAGLADLPAQYRWSSYHYNAKGIADPLVTPHEMYQSLGSDKERRREAYLALFHFAVNENTLKEIRDATNRAWVLGGNPFRKEVEELMQRQAAPKTKGGDRKSRSFQDLRRINRV